MSFRSLGRNLAISALQGRLGLQDWQIELSDKSSGEAYQAELNYRDIERVAEIRMAQGLPEEMDSLCIAHEMVHLAIHTYEELAQRLLVFVTDDQARTTFAELLEDANEQAVDTLAHALVGGPRFMAYGDMVEDFPAYVRKPLIN